MPKRYGHLQVRENDRHAWVDTPTITKLRVALDGLEEAGVGADAPLMITQLANALSVFTIRELVTPDTNADAEVWARRIGATDS
jgi:hypothetical protein